MRRVLFVVLSSVLLLTISACSFPNGNNVSRVAVSNSGINSIGGIGGDGAASKPATTPTQAADIADITVSPLTPLIGVDDSTQFTATAKDAGDETIQWASSEPGVATIDSNGVATGMSAGTTQITATANGKTSSPVALTLCDYRHI